MTDRWTAEQADADPDGFGEHLLSLRGRDLFEQGLVLDPELEADVAAMPPWEHALTMRKWLGVYWHTLENGPDGPDDDPDPGDGSELPASPTLEDLWSRGPPEARRRAGGAASEAARVDEDDHAVIHPPNTADKQPPYWPFTVVADPATQMRMAAYIAQAERDVFDDDPTDDDPTDDELLTDWEIDFLASIESQDYELTDRQQAKYDEIMDSLDARRSAVRSGMLARTR